MNWSKTIKIDDHRRLGFNPYEMKIALLIDGVWCWSKTFDVSVGSREFSTLCCLGFEQIIKPDSYSVSKAIEFEPNEEIDAFVHLVISFENSYDKLARSIIDNHIRELQS